MSFFDYSIHVSGVITKDRLPLMASILSDIPVNQLSADDIDDIIYIGRSDNPWHLSACDSFSGNPQIPSQWALDVATKLVGLGLTCLVDSLILKENHFIIHAPGLSGPVFLHQDNTGGFHLLAETALTLTDAQRADLALVLPLAPSLKDAPLMIAASGHDSFEKHARLPAPFRALLHLPTAA